jgi:hypothetical protein
MFFKLFIFTNYFLLFLRILLTEWVRQIRKNGGVALKKNHFFNPLMKRFFLSRVASLFGDLKKMFF